MTKLLRGLAWGGAALVLALAIVRPGAAFAVTDAQLRQAEAALQSAPADGAKRLEVARLHYLKGSDFSVRGDASKAAGEFKSALSVLQDRQSRISAQSPVYEEVRYGLGYAYLALGQPQDAVVVLDQLAEGSPRFTRARYLLGVALLRTGSEPDTKRGIEVLIQLAKETPGPDGTAASHAATRYAYDIALGMAAAGKAAAAAAVLQDVRDRLGPASGANAAENEASLFALGTFQVWAGNAPAGLADYDALKSQDAGFHLASGVTIRQALSDASYQLGLQDLSKGGDAALQKAIADFDVAEANGTAKDADVHHGKAVAYKRMNEDQNLVKELAAILQADPDYYKKINTGT